ncbi:hypothetical protein [Nannocystis pusilla]|uniref:Uncharacterized protein n=1 Tax=Nannocystis pusilla TaxID=889268 RepID=A0ABS7TSE8_9BACT|nr:hypothetical protein [Nannocystis pusilla]MBZ5711077.1 hypothetical protein [Nannocystis pusilla]
MSESTTEPTIHPLRRAASGAAAALLLLVTACGDDVAGSATTDETTTTTGATTTTATETTAEPTASGDPESGSTSTSAPTTSMPVSSTTDDDTTTGTSMPVSSTTGDTTTDTADTTTTSDTDGVCEPGASEDCYSGPDGTRDVGVCKAGVRTCADDGSGFGPCVGEVTPSPEDCSTPADDNCLGDVPECGAALWVEQFGGPLENETSSLVVGPDDAIAITGRFYGALDFGGGALVSAGLYDGYLASFDGDGHHVWSRRFGSAGQEYGREVAFDAAGGVVLSANIEGAGDLGGGTLASTGAQDIAVARYDAGGAHEWSAIYHGPDNQIGVSCAIDSHDDVILGGVFNANFELGPATLTSAGDVDIYLARLDGGGGYQWAESFGSADHQYALTTVDGDDDLLQAGYFVGQLDYGGGPMLANGRDVFLAKLDGDGGHVWSQRFGDAGDQRIQTLATDAAGRVLVGGHFDGVLDFGGGPLMHEGNFDGFVAVFAADGDHLWSRRLGGPGTSRIDAITADAAGNVIVGGIFNQTVDLGGGAELTAGPNTSAFLAKYDPAGELLHAVSLGAGAGYHWLAGVATDSADHVVVLGSFSENIDIAGEVLTTAGKTDIFLAKLAL